MSQSLKKASKSAANGRVSGLAPTRAWEKEASSRQVEREQSGLRRVAGIGCWETEEGAMQGCKLENSGVKPGGCK
jgi:hypothetical protein